MADMTLDTKFDYQKIPFDKDSEIHLDVILSAPERDEEKRIPLHLILAIDASGSMAGLKMRTVKETAGKLVDHLTENDTLGIIAFSTNVWDVLQAVPMTTENKIMAKEKIKGLSTHSSTNLSEAMIMAMEKAVVADKAKTSRIILLTDGNPTTGVCDQEGLVKLAANMNPAVSISTFGYGQDFDAELMTSVVRVGRGNSFYIESHEDCPKAFAMELGGLLSLYAQNIKLTVTPENGFLFEELLSDYKCEQKSGYRLLTNKKIVVELSDIYAGENKHVLLKLKAPKVDDPREVSRVCLFDLEYTDTESKETVTDHRGTCICYVPADDAQTDADPEVKKQLALIEVAKIQKEAKDKAEEGKMEEAREILTRGVTWVNDNSITVPNSEQVVSMFQTLTANYQDRFTYSTIGSKLAEASYMATVSNRGTSAGSMDFANVRQKQMYKSFSEPPKTDEDA